jgi:hypothetical protein
LHKIPLFSNAKNPQIPTMRLFSIFATLALLFCSGCILPAPHWRVHEYGVRGQIIDARNQTPVTNASVSAVWSSVDPVISDSAGNFRIPAVRGFHGAYCIGPLFLSMLPGFDQASPLKEVYVTAPGYISTSFEIEYTRDPLGGRVSGVIKGAYLYTQLRLVPASGE